MREISVLREEPVARMNCVRTRRQRCGDDQIAAKVRFGRRISRQSNGRIGVVHIWRIRVCVGVNRHRGDAEVTAGTKDPTCDLATVRHQN